MEYTACIARVTALPGGEGTGNIGNSLRQPAPQGQPTARYRVDMPPFVMQTHNAAQASNHMACDHEESDVLRKTPTNTALPAEKRIDMT
jgi:hypothetical protein